LRFTQVSAPQLELWLGLEALVRSIQRSPHQDIHIKKEETTPGCPATMPRGPGTTPLSRTRFPADTALHLHQLPQHTTYL